MQCPDCGGYRHPGPCTKSYWPEPEPDDLEMLAIDAERARERYLEALAKHKEQRHESV